MALHFDGGALLGVVVVHHVGPGALRHQRPDAKSPHQVVAHVHGDLRGGRFRVVVLDLGIARAGVREQVVMERDPRGMKLDEHVLARLGRPHDAPGHGDVVGIRRDVDTSVVRAMHRHMVDQDVEGPVGDLNPVPLRVRGRAAGDVAHAQTPQNHIVGSPVAPENDAVAREGDPGRRSAEAIDGEMIHLHPQERLQDDRAGDVEHDVSVPLRHRIAQAPGHGSVVVAIVLERGDPEEGSVRAAPRAGAEALKGRASAPEDVQGDEAPGDAGEYGAACVRKVPLVRLVKTIGSE